jgi:hypothetical protein
VSRYDAAMTEAEKLKSDLDTLRESIQRDWQDLARAPTARDRESILEHLMWCDGELAGLRTRLEAATDDDDA